MTPEQQAKADNEFLLTRPEFRRFLSRVIQMAALFRPTTDGSEGRHLAYAEGRRNLGLEILADVATGQPVDDPEAHLTLFQVLRELTQPQPLEKPHGRRNNDRHDELRDDADRD